MDVSSRKQLANYNKIGDEIEQMELRLKHRED